MTFPFAHRTVEENERRFRELDAISRRRSLTDAESRELEREMRRLGRL